MSQYKNKRLRKEGTKSHGKKFNTYHKNGELPNMYSFICLQVTSTE
jgi:hypothetical protein